MDFVAQLEGITKVYHKGRDAPAVYALGGVDLTISRGQYVAVMGPSGSGKSTLMNILGCLDRPTAGRYLLEGQDVARMSDDELSRIRGTRLGFIFQAFNLINQLTVLGNVQVPLFYQGVHRRIRKQRAREAIDRVGLSDRADHRPAELSGGQMQRVAIARALVNQPSILFADEPTGNLDSTTGKSILALVDELHQQGLTIIMVTHDESIAHRCQRVIRLRDGTIESDTLRDVKVEAAM
ncbi:MAG: ABC transporter ATP-binding protein [Phycisphaeraceae bacterium]|nr:ABC transporter ATP-binding protein [Phycisphaeraceae bacterium]